MAAAGRPEGPGFDEALSRAESPARSVQLHRRMPELLNAVQAISGELELSAVLRTITDTARRLVDAEYGALGVLSEAGEFVDLIPSGIAPEAFARLDQLPHGGGLLGELVRNPRPLRVNNLAEHPGAAGFPPGHPRMTSLLGVPIRVRGSVYGNLYLTDKHDGEPFTDADEALLRTLASAAGVAIENARLYKRLLGAAEEYQRRLLPALPDEGHVQLQARYLPSTDIPRIGGDWYDVVRLPDDVLCLVIGDVMGHDLQAATVMSQISNMLRVIAFDQRDPPSGILHHLDEVLHCLHGGPMATVLLARLEAQDSDHWRLWWSSAGHLPPLFITPDGQAHYLDRADQGLPLGVDPDLPRRDHEEHLTNGSTLLLYTDGLVERPGEHLGAGMDDLVRSAAACVDQPLPDLCDAVLARLGADMHDDVALLAARLIP